MTNLAHIGETALLVLVAYLMGCFVGYAAHRVLHAGRGTRKISPPISVSTPARAPEQVAMRVPTPAARLAATASNEPIPLSPVQVRSPQPAKVKRSQPTPQPKTLGPKPETLATPRGDKADNLKQIKGVGPKIEASLNALGIFHIDQIASWTEANVAWVDSQLAFKGRIRREHWVEQAKALAAVRA